MRTLPDTSVGESPTLWRPMDARTSAALTPIAERQPGHTSWRSDVQKASINFFIRLPHRAQTIVNNVRLSVMGVPSNAAGLDVPRDRTDLQQLRSVPFCTGCEHTTSDNDAWVTF